MIAVENNKKLAAGLRLQQQAEQELEKRSAKVRRLRIASHLKDDPRHEALTGRMTVLRKTRHRHRLHRSRAKYSFRCQLDKIKETRTKISDMNDVDRAMTVELEAMAADMQHLEDDILQALDAASHGQ